jgi:hypothetical protein
MNKIVTKITVWRIVEEVNVSREIQRLIFVSDQKMKKVLVMIVPKTLSSKQRIRRK